MPQYNALLITLKIFSLISGSTMKFLIAILFSLVTLNSLAQMNFVRNGDFEQYSNCPYNWDQLTYAKFWRPTVDSAYWAAGEYYNSCSNSFGDRSTAVPNNINFYQYAHSGEGFLGLHLFYDKTSPSPHSGLPFNYRDYAQVRLYKNLSAGKTYCVSFWVVKTEFLCYAHNKIGAYLDNGAINKAVDSVGKEITSVVPQVYTNSIIKDTMHWTRIEGSFVAKGTESMITIGNFFPNSAVDTTSTDCWPGGLPQYSYYLIDDVSVVAIDAKANAGVDRWVELGKSTAIGPIEDNTSRAMDCKWYHKGKLIDSGNVISVNSSSIKYAVDTYVVVQNVCGNITRDTMLLRTMPLGIPLLGGDRGGFTISPNPSNGNITITTDLSNKNELISTKVYDLLGRVVHQEPLNFNNNTATLQLQIPTGMYILELQNKEGVLQRERVVVE
jgi:hypothetical protein